LGNRPLTLSPGFAIWRPFVASTRFARVPKSSTGHSVQLEEGDRGNGKRGRPERRGSGGFEANPVVPVVRTVSAAYNVAPIRDHPDHVALGEATLLLLVGQGRIRLTWGRPRKPRLPEGEDDMPRSPDPRKGAWKNQPANQPALSQGKPAGWKDQQGRTPGDA